MMFLLTIAAAFVATFTPTGDTGTFVLDFTLASFPGTPVFTDSYFPYSVRLSGDMFATGTSGSFVSATA